MDSDGLGYPETRLTEASSQYLDVQLLKQEKDANSELTFRAQK